MRNAAGDKVHLLHVAPRPTDKHIFLGMYVPPDEGAEEQEASFCSGNREPSGALLVPVIWLDMTSKQTPRRDRLVEMGSGRLL